MSPTPASKPSRKTPVASEKTTLSDVSSSDDDNITSAPVLVTVEDHVEDENLDDDNLDDDNLDDDNVDDDAAATDDAAADHAVTEQLVATELPVVEPTPEPQPAPQPAVVAAAAIAPEPAPKPSRKRRRFFFRWFLRLFVLGAIAVGAYFAWPTINERYIQPVETTAADLSTVQDRLGASDVRATDLETRLDAVEASQLGVAERLDGLDTSALDQAARIDAIDTLIADQTTRLDALDELAATLGTDLGDTNAAASRQLGVTRATELMSRARLFLYQANYGLAIADLTDARATLAALDVADPTITEVISRLDRAILNLPALPVAASADVDIAWQSLLGPTPVATDPAAPTTGGATSSDGAAATDGAATDGSATTATTTGG